LYSADALVALIQVRFAYGITPGGNHG
jgi:hypothetical protein